MSFMYDGQEVPITPQQFGAMWDYFTNITYSCNPMAVDAARETLDMLTALKEGRDDDVLRIAMGIERFIFPDSATVQAYNERETIIDERFNLDLAQNPNF